MKILFFHVPSLGQYNSIEPILLELAARGHTVVHYNYGGFSAYPKPGPVQFRAYPGYQGYLPSLFTTAMNVYDLGLLLLDTAEHMMDFVEAEVLRELPDLVLHSKFLAAPKAVAARHRIPAGCLTTGFVFHPSVVLEREKTAPVSRSGILSLRRFTARAEAFYARHGGGAADPNDVFVNEEPLNLVLGLRRFQPPGRLDASKYTFVGPTMRVPHYAKSYELIYVSLGSVFVDNLPFFKLCIEALAGAGKRVVISLSDRLSPAQFGPVPPGIELARFVPQQEILQRAALFITHGGGNSVYEAIYCATPMIVIPQIADQVFYAQQVESLGLGTAIAPADLTVAGLRAAVAGVLGDDRFRQRVQALKDTLPAVPPAVTACDCLEAMALRASAVGPA